MKKSLMIFLCALIVQIFASSGQTAECDGIEMFKILETLTDVGRFHNCALEVIKLESHTLDKDKTEQNLVSLLVYGRDLFRCQNTNKCPEANFEITVSKECVSNDIPSAAVLRNSNGYNLDGRKLRNHMEIKTNFDHNPIQISFGQTDLTGANRLNYVSCKLNPLSGD